MGTASGSPETTSSRPTSIQVSSMSPETFFPPARRRAQWCCPGRARPAPGAPAQAAVHLTPVAGEPDAVVGGPAPPEAAAGVALRRSTDPGAEVVGHHGGPGTAPTPM